MASAAFAMLLAASLLQACASDTRAFGRAPAARKLKASMSPSPRSGARELREEVDRRLTMQPSQECLAACPDLQTLQTGITTASSSLMQSSGSSFSFDEAGDSTFEMAELMAGILEITIDHFCAHRPAVQCVVDNPSACSAESGGILEFAPKLDCLCDACPSAKPALAHFTGTFMSAFVTAFSGDSSEGLGTTTQALDSDSATNTSDGELDDLTDLQMEMMCGMYPLFSCAINQPTQCGSGILIDGVDDVPNMTTDELALLEEMCPTIEESNNPTIEESNNCGFISLAWLSASLPLVVTALQFDAAR